MSAIQKMVKFIDTDEMTGEENANILWRKFRKEATRLASEEAKDIRKKEAELGLILSLPLEVKDIRSEVGSYVNREAVLSCMRHELDLSADDVYKAYKAVERMCGYYVPKAKEKPTLTEHGAIKCPCCDMDFVIEDWMPKPKPAPILTPCPMLTRKRGVYEP